MDEKTKCEIRTLDAKLKAEQIEVGKTLKQSASETEKTAALDRLIEIVQVRSELQCGL